MSDDPDDSSDLHARVALLEARVEALSAELERQRTAQPAAPRRAASRPKRPRVPRPPREKVVLRSEDWLNRIGIGLLLFGLAFLFKYSVDQGWIGPLVRLGFGAALGAVLMGVGMRLHTARRRYGQVLMGGGVAVWYATVFAAFQLYGLVSYGLAFGLMLAVTGLGFALSVRQRDAVLAVVATQGGLGTPFLLYSATGSIPALVAYTSLILACALALYLLYGWRTLLFTAVIGGWLVLAAVATDVHQSSPFGDRVAFWAGITWAVLLFGGVPVWRAIRHHRDPERWPRPPLEWFKDVTVVEEPARLLAVAVPVVNWLLTFDMLGGTEYADGLVWLGAAGVYAALYAWLRPRLPGLASAHGIALVFSATLGFAYLLEGAELQVAALAGVATLAHVAATRFGDRGLRFAAHALSLLVGIAVWGGLGDALRGTPLVRPDALLDLAAIALLAAAAGTLAGRVRGGYLLVAYALGLGWLWRELVALPNGQAFVSVAWGICALVLLAAGARRDAEGLRWTGLGTLLLVVAKLFVIDLAELEAIWRILLFLGFGALLLVVSYLFPSVWRAGEERLADGARDDGESRAQRSR